jgi:hypothetical protein
MAHVSRADTVSDITGRQTAPHSLTEPEWSTQTKTVIVTGSCPRGGGCNDRLQRADGESHDVSRAEEVNTVQTVDCFLGALVVGSILLGSNSWWRATQRAREMDGMRMTIPGMDPLWYLFGTLIAISVILGGYVVSRDQVAHVLSTSEPAPTMAEERSESDTSPLQDSSSEALLESPDHDVSASSSSGRRAAALTFLPKDEQRGIEPILESLDLTQVEFRDRSEFPKQE